MTTETQRDLHADLLICAAVPEVYYDEGGGYTASSLTYTATQFFEAAPVAWPHAIERAVTAERRLLALVEALERGDIAQTRMSSGTDYVIYNAKKAVGR